jgi:hypothetical protein
MYFTWWGTRVWLLVHNNELVVAKMIYALEHLVWVTDFVTQLLVSVAMISLVSCTTEHMELQTPRRSCWSCPRGGAARGCSRRLWSRGAPQHRSRSSGSVAAMIKIAMSWMGQFWPVDDSWQSRNLTACWGFWTHDSLLQSRYSEPKA